MGPFMRRTRLALSVAAILVLSAGLVVGRLIAPAPRPAAHGGRGWFNDALDLSSEQRKQMDAIWSDTRGQIGRTMDRRHELDRKRDAAVRALLSPAEQAAYDKVWADYRAGRTALDQDRERLVREANDRSKALLTDAQKARWEAMTREMHDRKDGDRRDNDHKDGGSGDHGGRPPPGPPPADGPR